MGKCRRRICKILREANGVVEPRIRGWSADACCGSLAAAWRLVWCKELVHALGEDIGKWASKSDGREADPKALRTSALPSARPLEMSAHIEKSSGGRLTKIESHKQKQSRRAGQRKRSKRRSDGLRA